MRRVLFICTSFPPVVGGGSVRNLQIARGLAARGWTVTVLTGRKRSPLYDDVTPLRTLPSEVRVVRAFSPDLAALARGGVAAAGTRPSAAGDEWRHGWLHAMLRELALTWLLIPDADAPWIPFAAREGLRTLGGERFDAILTAGPPHSSHIVGRILRARTDLRWIVDSQDPWADHPFPRTTAPLRIGIDRWLERSVFGAADVVVSATDSQTRRFREVHRARAERFLTLPCGYDEADFAADPPPLTRRIVHLGSFYGARSPRAFLEAIGSLTRRRPNLLEGHQVLLAGYADAESGALIQRALADPMLAGVLRALPQVDRLESVALMRSALILLLVTDPGAGGRDLIPIKTFEYLRAGRPILALVPDGETAALLERTGGALIAPPDDAKAIETALATMLADPAACRPPDAALVRGLEFGAALDRLDALLAPSAAPAGR